MRKKTHRKHYTLVNPIMHAITGATIPSEESLDGLRQAEQSAIEAFAAGQATAEDWHRVNDMSNYSETMAKDGVGPEVLAVVHAVEDALSASLVAYTAGQLLATTPEGLKAMRDLAEFHHLQRTSIDASSYARAIRATKNNIRSRHPELRVLA